MDISVQIKLNKNQKMKKYLYENSNWFKYLNRNPNNYSKFESAMKELYKEKTTDKISNVMDNINLVSSVLDVINN